MPTLIKILCLAVSLALATAGPSWAKTSDDSKKTKSQGKSSSKSTSQSKDKAKSKGKEKSRGKTTDGAGSESPSSRPSKKGAKFVAGGFRTLAWGAPILALTGLEVREEQGQAAYCTRRGDDMEVYGATMREIVYVFCREKLAGVLTRYDGEVNHVILLAKLTERYGPPLETQPNLRQERAWRFSDGSNVAFMEYSASAATGAVAYFAPALFSPCEGQVSP